jgi:hypothetical protein
MGQRKSWAKGGAGCSIEKKMGQGLAGRWRKTIDGLRVGENRPGGNKVRKQKWAESKGS